MLHSDTYLFFAADDSGGSAADVKEIDVDQLSRDELEKAEVDDDTDQVNIKTPDADTKEDDQTEDSPPDKKPAEETGKKEESEKPEEKPEEKSLDDQIKDIEDVPKDERTAEQTLELRRLHAERKMHEATQKAADLERKLAELEEKQAEQAETASTFQELSKEEEDALMQDDPDEYRKYLADKEKYESGLAQKAVAAKQTTFNNIVGLYQEVTGADGEIKDLANSKEFAEWLKSDEFKAVDKFVTNNMIPRKGIYSVEQMRSAYRALNFDKAVGDAQVKGRQEAVDDIKKAKTRGSEFDKVAKETGKKGSKSLDDFTDEEIDNMSKEERAQVIEDMRRQGLA